MDQERRNGNSAPLCGVYSTLALKGLNKSFFLQYVRFWRKNIYNVTTSRRKKTQKETKICMQFPGVCSVVITWNITFFEFFFLLTYLMFIYGHLFSSLFLNVCSACQVITIMQINLFFDWISCHVVFVFQSMNWSKREKKCENSSVLPA